MLIETSMEVLLLINPLICLQALLGVFGLVGDRNSINNTDVINNVLPLRSEVLD